jgi:hypothetical protein
MGVVALCAVSALLLCSAHPGWQLGRLHDSLLACARFLELILPDGAEALVEKTPTLTGGMLLALTGCHASRSRCLSLRNPRLQQRSYVLRLVASASNTPRSWMLLGVSDHLASCPALTHTLSNLESPRRRRLEIKH